MDAAQEHTRLAQVGFLDRGDDDSLLLARECIELEELLEDAGAATRGDSQARDVAAAEVAKPGAPLEHLRAAVRHLDAIEPGDRPTALGPVWAELHSVLGRATA